MHYTPESVAVRLEALADGRPVFERSLAPGEAVRLRLQAPADAPALFRLLALAGVRAAPSGTSRDVRELGVMALSEPGN